MRNNVLIESVVIITFLISCSDASQLAPGSEGYTGVKGKDIGEFLSSPNGNFGRISIINKTIPMIGGDRSALSISSYFVPDTSTGDKVDAGTVIVAGNTLSKVVHSGRTRYHYSSVSTASTDGVVVSVSVGGGSGVPVISDSIYVPEVLHLASPTYNAPEHGWLADRSSGLNVSWNDDTNIDSVHILLTYLTGGDTTSFGDYPFRYWWIRTLDDGSYSIPAGIIDDFVAEAPLMLTVVRYSKKVVTISGKTYGFNASSMASYVLKLVD